MHEKPKLKLKKFYFHPITIFIVLTIFVMIISGILSALQMQATYSTVNINTRELEPTLVTVENMLSFDGIKFIISEAAKNFLSFGPLGMILLSMIGLTIAEGTGLIEAVTKRYISKMPKSTVTFIVLFLSIVSSLINEVGYAILIPLVALVYFINNRNPILGIVTAFCGVSFGYGISIFVGSMEVSLIDYTKAATTLIDNTKHIALSSNLIFIVAATIIMSFIGTVIIEKVISPKIGKYKREDDFAKTEQYKPINLEEIEEEEAIKEKNQKKGLHSAFVVLLVMIAIFVYSVIPHLPGSGLLLDMNAKTYVSQLFGDNSYFQDGFAFLVALVFALAGITYGISAKTIKNDKEIIENASKKFNNIGSIIIILFVAAQFIAVYRKTNIGIVITAWLSKLLEQLSVSGIPLILLAIVFIAISGLFLTSPANKWMIFSPVVVPMFMQSNISPQFAQIVMRAGDSMTKGFTPLLASFAIYIGFLNVYNLHKEKPYTIKKSLQMIAPYFLLMSLAWILLIVGWYIIGVPIGPGVGPTI